VHSGHTGWYVYSTPWVAPRVGFRQSRLRDFEFWKSSKNHFFHTQANDLYTTVGRYCTSSDYAEFVFTNKFNQTCSDTILNLCTRLKVFLPILVLLVS